MLIKVALPLLSASLLAIAVAHVARNSAAQVRKAPPRPPSQAPYAHAVAASGIVEPRSGFVCVGAPDRGLVARVLVEAGDQVPEGAPLFQLDDRHLRAELDAQNAAVRVAKAELARVESPPREDEVAAAQARVAEAEARLSGLRDHRKRVEQTFRRQASTEGELHRSRSRVEEGEAQLAGAQAALALLLDGTSDENREKARAEVALAEAQRERVAAEVERLTVRAPFDARVLRVDVRPSQAVSPNDTRPLLVLARTGKLQLRVDINEDELAEFCPRAEACALASRAGDKIPLELLRVEPYILPQPPEGGPHETVDSRVLQAVYSLPPSAAASLYPGQKLDVFICTTKPQADAARRGADRPGL